MKELLVTHEREKLINAAIYFLNNTNHCHTLKLFKLLNFLDFEHFRQTGYPVTGLDYSALPMGPVPDQFYDDIKNPPADISESLSIEKIENQRDGKLERREIKPRKDFNEQYFSKREIELMKNLAYIFNELKAVDMSEFSHMKGLPWRKVYKKGEGTGRNIPYELALTSDPIGSKVETIPAEDLQWERKINSEFGL